MKLDQPYLQPALWGTTDGALQVRQDVPLQAVVAGKTDEVSDPLLFAKLEQAWTGKGRIPPQPKLFEPGPVALNQRRDKICHNPGMAHIHKKMKKGRPYYYVRKMGRVGGKLKVIEQIYLGSPERIKELATSDTRLFGVLLRT
jgi:hypothetical protein